MFKAITGKFIPDKTAVLCLAGTRSCKLMSGLVLQSVSLKAHWKFDEPEQDKINKRRQFLLSKDLG